MNFNGQQYNIVHRLLNSWFFIVAMMIIFSYLPHWENVRFFTWMIYAFDFWLFLNTLFITFKDPLNKDVFVNLSILFFINAAGIINVFMGEHYLFGNNTSAYLVYEFSTIIICLSYVFCVSFIFLKLISDQMKGWIRYLLTLSITLGAAALLCVSCFVSPTSTFSSRELFFYDLYRRVFFLNLLSLIMIVLYGISAVIRNKSLGEYIHLIMASLFISTLLEIIDNWSRMFSFSIYELRLCVLTINFVFISIILFKKLIYTYSDFGQFYETLIANRFGMGRVRITPRHFKSNQAMMNILKMYLIQRFRFLLTLLLLIFIVTLYVRLPALLPIYLAAFILSMVTIISFHSAVHKKQNNEKYYNS